MNEKVIGIWCIECNKPHQTLYQNAFIEHGDESWSDLDTESHRCSTHVLDENDEYIHEYFRTQWNQHWNLNQDENRFDYVKFEIHSKLAMKIVAILSLNWWNLFSIPIQSAKPQGPFGQNWTGPNPD